MGAIEAYTASPMSISRVQRYFGHLEHDALVVVAREDKRRPGTVFIEPVVTDSCTAAKEVSAQLKKKRNIILTLTGLQKGVAERFAGHLRFALFDTSYSDALCQVRTYIRDLLQQEAQDS